MTVCSVKTPGLALLGKCDKCEKPATSMVRDSYEIPVDGVWRQYGPGEWRARCDEHFEPSVTHERDK